MLLGHVSAKSVDETTAYTVASHFFAMKYNHTPESLTPKIVYTAPSLRGENSSGPSFYVVNFNAEGFVIVAGDDRVQPILAFSDEGAFVVENMPAHVRFFWMDTSKRFNIWLITNSMPMSPSYNSGRPCFRTSSLNKKMEMW